MTILQKLPVALVGAEELAKVEVPAGLFEAAIQEDGRLPGGTVHRLNQPLEEWLRARLADLRGETSRPGFSWMRLDSSSGYHWVTC